MHVYVCERVDDYGNMLKVFSHAESKKAVKHLHYFAHNTKFHQFSLKSTLKGARLLYSAF